MDEEKPVSKRTLNTAERYLTRLRNGEKLMRDSQGKIQWSDGRSIGQVTLAFMMKEGIIRNLDTDLFGDRSRGQTLGLAE